MSDEAEKTSEPETAAAENESEGESAEERRPERVDEDGLPLDRDATIDDVRSKEGKHGRIAFGCALAVVLLLLLFWLIRGGVIG